MDDIDENGKPIRCKGDLEPLPEMGTRLTTSGRKGSGVQMKGAYDRLVGMCTDGSWKSSFCSGGLTVREFMIVVISGELSPFKDNRVKLNDPDVQAMLAEAGVNWFGDSCLMHEKGKFHNPCYGPTPNAIFNWMGENLQSAQLLFPSGAKPTEEYYAVRGLATKVVDAVLSVSSDPTLSEISNPCGYVHWGNKSYYQTTYHDVPDSKYAVLPGDAFYVIPYAEENRMNGGQNYCP